MNATNAPPQVTSPLPELPLKKSNRPHLFVLAFSLDQRRQLRTKGGEDLLWSAVKLRNATTPQGTPSGGLRFRVPAGRDASTLTVYLASNYLDPQGTVPWRLAVAAPEGEMRPLTELPRPGESGCSGGLEGGSEEANEGSRQSSCSSSAVDAEKDASPAGELSELGDGSLPRRLLCLDGGGSKGVIPLEALAELERRTGVRTRDQFDLFAGTSTGSIIAAGLAYGDLPVSVLASVYVNLAQLIFGSRLTAAQRSTRLRAIMTAIFGHAPLLTPCPPGGAPEADPTAPPKRFLAMATDMSQVQLRPFVFRSFRPPSVSLVPRLGHHLGQRLGRHMPLDRHTTLGHTMLGDGQLSDDLGDDLGDDRACDAVLAPLYDGQSCRVTVVDALLASTAAPTFFSPHNMTVREQHDGGRASELVHDKQQQECVFAFHVTMCVPGRLCVCLIAQLLAPADPWLPGRWRGADILRRRPLRQ